MFKLGVIDINKRGEFVAWSSKSGIDYIKNLGKATYNAGYVLDLSFFKHTFYDNKHINEYVLYVRPRSLSYSNLRQRKSAIKTSVLLYLRGKA
jgi:hypothetical protein